MSDILSHLDVLAGQAHAEGGWGYAPGQAAHVEPTCLALLALTLEADRYQTAIAAGRLALDRCATPDGSYRLGGGREEAVWPTALVLFVQAVLGSSEEEIRRTASRLLGLRGRVPPGTKTPDMIDIDFQLIGWPWAENNFSWAEPTAWACLALRRAGYGTHPRVEEGRRLLLDRALDEGGINYGNRRIFGRLTEPLPGPTALMLLALQGQGGEPKVDAAAAYLQEHALASQDLEHLCWAKLALDLYRDRAGVPAALARLDARIVDAHRSRETTGWLRPAPLREALTALALAAGPGETRGHGDTETGRGTAGGTTNYFRLPADLPAPVAASPCPRVAASPCAPPPARRRPWPERLKSAVRGLALEAAGRLRQPAAPATVHIARAEDYNDDLAGTLRRQYEAFRARVHLAGKRVVLKPNLVEYHRDKVINTDPRVVAAAIELCRHEGAAEVVVAEGPGHCRNVEYLVEASGLGDVLRHYGVSFVDLNHDEPVKRPNLGRLTGLEDLFLARTVACADVLISMPKLKTHHWAGATLSLKNLFGTLPGICYGWPKNELHWRGIDQSIVDIALTRTPELAIVDGITGMEGDGPLNGSPKHLGALVMGADLVAVDATCCRLMQLDPERIGYLVLGYRKRLGLLGEKEIRQLGEAVGALAQPFETLAQFQGLHLCRPA